MCRDVHELDRTSRLLRRPPKDRGCQRSDEWSVEGKTTFYKSQHRLLRPLSAKPPGSHQRSHIATFAYAEGLIDYDFGDVEVGAIGQNGMRIAVDGAGNFVTRRTPRIHTGLYIDVHALFINGIKDLPVALT
jgi:hypothetical protein